MFECTCCTTGQDNGPLFDVLPTDASSPVATSENSGVAQPADIYKHNVRLDDDSCYTGQMVNDQLDGYGSRKWSDGKKYVGQWRDGKMHGKGAFTWPDGKSYDGDYDLDRKHGFGTFRWPDGRWFKGQWVDGKQHGDGEVYNRKEVQNGFWENGKRTR